MVTRSYRKFLKTVFAGFIQEFLLETVHILSTISRHEEALQIYAIKMKDWKLAENYCLEYYQRSNMESSQLFTILYDLYQKHGNPNSIEKLLILNKFGFRMKFRNVFAGFDRDLKFRQLDSYIQKNIISLSDSTSMQILVSQLHSVRKENVLIFLN